MTPTRLPTDQVVIQTAIRPDITRNDSGLRGMAHFRATHDIRWRHRKWNDGQWDVAPEVRSILGQNGRSQVDPVEFLARFRKQAEERELPPSTRCAARGCPRGRPNESWLARGRWSRPGIFGNRAGGSMAIWEQGGRAVISARPLGPASPEHHLCELGFVKSPG